MLKQNKYREQKKKIYIYLKINRLAKKKIKFNHD